PQHHEDDDKCSQHGSSVGPDAPPVCLVGHTVSGATGLLACFSGRDTLGYMFRRVAPVCVCLLLVAVVGLSAHLKVERTAPVTDATVTEAPVRIQVWFSQSPTL